MFQLLQATKWTHLPRSGGWNDQHPGFVDRTFYLLAEKSKADAEEQKRREADMKNKTRSRGGGRVAGRRR